MRTFIFALACIVAAAIPPAALLAYRADDWLPRALVMLPIAGDILPEGKEFDPHELPGEVLYFVKANCTACEQMEPVVTELREKGYRIRLVRVDQRPELAEKLGIRTMPTFMYVLDGEEVRRSSGCLSGDELRRMFRSPNGLL
jgi:thiol-disulfide isomerase/thioredoxin